MKTVRIGKRRSILEQSRLLGMLNAFQTATYVMLPGFALSSPDARRWATSRRWRKRQW